MQAITIELDLCIQVMLRSLGHIKVVSVELSLPLSLTFKMSDLHFWPYFLYILNILLVSVKTERLKLGNISFYSYLSGYYRLLISVLKRTFPS